MIAIIVATDPSPWWLLAAGGIGAVVSIIGTWVAGVFGRRSFVQDRTRTEAREACIAFLRDASYCAHQIGNLAPSEHGVAGDAEARKKAAYYFDRETSDRFRVVEVATPKSIVGPAQKYRDELRTFRDKMCDPKVELPTYRSDVYAAWYDPVVKARGQFVEVVRRELGLG